MAKVNGMWGKGTGKVGALVYQINSGVQIVKEKSTHVSNPNTAAQFEQRAKLKLMSQLAAAVSPVIVIPKQGLQSSRNLFIKKNFGLVTFDNGEASVECRDLQITAGSIPGPEGLLQVDSETQTASLVFNAESLANVNRVVVSVFEIDENKKASFIDSNVTSVEDIAGGRLDLGRVPEKFFVLIYGMKDVNASATSKFESYEITDATSIAALAATRTLKATDYVFTTTTGHSSLE